MPAVLFQCFYRYVTLAASLSLLLGLQPWSPLYGNVPPPAPVASCLSPQPIMTSQQPSLANLPVKCASIAAPKPNNTSPNHTMASLNEYYAHKDYLSLLKRLEQAQETTPNDPALLFNLGLTYYALHHVYSNGTTPYLAQAVASFHAAKNNASPQQPNIATAAMTNLNFIQTHLFLTYAKLPFYSYISALYDQNRTHALLLTTAPSHAQQANTTTTTTAKPASPPLKSTLPTLSAHFQSLLRTLNTQLPLINQRLFTLSAHLLGIFIVILTVLSGINLLKTLTQAAPPPTQQHQPLPPPPKSRRFLKKNLLSPPSPQHWRVKIAVKITLGYAILAIFMLITTLITTVLSHINPQPTAIAVIQSKNAVLYSQPTLTSRKLSPLVTGTLLTVITPSATQPHASYISTTSPPPPHAKHLKWHYVRMNEDFKQWALLHMRTSGTNSPPPTTSTTPSPPQPIPTPPPATLEGWVLSKHLLYSP